MRPESTVDNDEQLAQSFFTGIGDIEEDDYIEEKELYASQDNKIKTYESSGGGGGNGPNSSGGGGAGGAGKEPNSGPSSDVVDVDGRTKRVDDPRSSVSLYAGEEPPANSTMRQLAYVPPNVKQGVSRDEYQAVIDRNKAMDRMVSSGTVNEEDWDKIQGTQKKEAVAFIAKVNQSDMVVRQQEADAVSKVAEVATRPPVVDADRVLIRIEELLGGVYNELSKDRQESLLASVVSHVAETNYGRRVMVGDKTMDFNGLEGGSVTQMASVLIGDSTEIVVQEVAIDTATLSYVVKLIVETNINIALEPLLQRVIDVRAARALLIRNVEDAARSSNVSGFASLVNFIGPYALRSRVDSIAYLFFKHYVIPEKSILREEAYKLNALFERIDPSWMTRVANGGKVTKLRAFMDISRDAKTVLLTDDRTQIAAELGSRYGYASARDIIDNMYRKRKKHWD